MLDKRMTPSLSQRASARRAELPPRLTHQLDNGAKLRAAIRRETCQMLVCGEDAGRAAMILVQDVPPRVGRVVVVDCLRETMLDSARLQSLRNVHTVPSNTRQGKTDARSRAS